MDNSANTIAIAANTIAIIGIIIGIVIGAVGAGVPLWIHFRERSVKKFGYRTRTSTPILSIKENVGNKLAVTYGGQPVLDPYLVAIQFVCYGQETIAEEDYGKRISITFDDTVKILYAEVSEEIPRDLGASLDLRPHEVILRPVMLNADDQLTIKIVLDNYKEVQGFEIGGRIRKVKEIVDLGINEKKNQARSKRSKKLINGIGCQILFLISIPILATFGITIANAFLRFMLPFLGLN